MKILEKYFSSPTLIQHLAQICGPNYNEKTLISILGGLTASALRWHQIFDNANIDYPALQINPANQADFDEYITLIVDQMQKSSLGFGIGFERNLTVINGLEQTATNVLGNDFEEKYQELVIRGASKFHGFNGVFEESIRAHGISPQNKFYQQSELDAIEKILFKINRTLGFSHTDKGRVSYSTSPSVTYNYALGSPEWFKFFCGRNSYLNRDYDQAKQYVANSLNLGMVTEPERKQVIDFFDKYWQLFAQQNTAPMVAITPYFTNENQIQNALKTYENAEQILHAEPYTVIDGKTDEVISTARAEFITLPNSEMVMERLNQYFTKQTANESELGLC